jgi:putative endonuclease
MYIVYVLQDNNNKYYKGMTDNIERRLKEHRRGKTKSTKNMSDLRIVYTERLETRIEARKREKYLKSAAGRRFLKNKINI